MAHDTSTDPINELVSLFLDDADDTVDLDDADVIARVTGSAHTQSRPVAAKSGDERVAGRPSKRANLEVLLSGNLPVLVGPWVAQAAAERARQIGRVGLLRPVADAVIVDLHPGDPAISATSSSLDELVSHLSPSVDCWIASLTSPEQLSSLNELAIDQVHLLTGADEAATVAAFAVLKRLAQLRPDLRSVSLIVVGCDGDRAARIADALARAATSRLDVELTLTASIPRISPAPMLAAGAFPAAEGPLAAIARCLRSSADRPVEMPVEPTAIAEPDRATDRLPEVFVRPAARELTTMPVTPRLGPAVKVGVASRTTTTSKPAASLDTVAIDDAPMNGEAATPGPTSKQSSAALAGAAGEFRADDGDPARPPDLALLMPRLQALPVRCPKARHVRFGLDVAGRLHALAWDHDADTLTDLLAAADWATEHTELLALVAPALDRHGHPPAMHLFTDRPRAHHRLIDGRIRLHLLTRPTPERTVAGWVHAELN